MSSSRCRWMPALNRCRLTDGVASYGWSFDPGAPPLVEYLDPLPALLAPYQLHRLRMRTYLSTVLPANWKVAVDAFDEAYQVQGTHPQILPWTDDVSLDYEPLGIHSTPAGCPTRGAELRPSPRLGLSEGEYDEGEILESFIRGLGGLFYKDERALVEEIRGNAPGCAATMLSRYQKGRRCLAGGSGRGGGGLRRRSADECEQHNFFPNMVGPICPGIRHRLPRSAQRHRSGQLHQGHVVPRTAPRRRWAPEAGQSSFLR